MSEVIVRTTEEILEQVSKALNDKPEEVSNILFLASGTGETTISNTVGDQEAIGQDIAAFLGQYPVIKQVVIQTLLSNLIGEDLSRFTREN